LKYGKLYTVQSILFYKEVKMNKSSLKSLNIGFITITMFLLGTTFYAEGNGGFSQNLETPRHWQEQSAYYNTLHECELRGGSFDSTNMYYVGNWPFSKAYCVDIDIARQLIFVSSGGGVNIVDVSDPTNPIILDGYKIRTRGNIAGQQAIGWGAQYLPGLIMVMHLKSGMLLSRKSLSGLEPGTLKSR
jgi:hypothetical protein